VRPHRSQQLLQARERERRFRLNASRREHVHVPLLRQRDRLGQQPRLADARIAAQDERSARAPDVIQ
jgi:hypothetical protein